MCLKLLPFFMCLAPLLIFTPITHADFQAGQEAFNRGDYATALKEWEPLANEGEADAQYKLGILYHNGLGVPQNKKEAFRWFLLAAEQGDATTQLGIGLQYTYGVDAPQDFTEAARWYRKAADKGNSLAQSVLGGLYEKGQGVPQDYVRAHKWYSLAAAQGSKEASEKRDQLANKLAQEPIAETKHLAPDDKVKVPFLFSEDEGLPQTDLQTAVPRSNALAADTYLNGPFTRLDYLLMMLENELNKEGNRLRVLWEVEEGFEPMGGFMGKEPPEITGIVRYEQTLGRIAVQYLADNLGRPRIPMRETCDKILSFFEFIAPKGFIGNLYHNTILGILAQKDFAVYTPALNTLAKSIVHGVTLKSKTEGGKVIHALTCIRFEKEAPIQYSRHSFKLR